MNKSMEESMKSLERTIELGFVITSVFISEVLKNDNDSILICWYQWFMPNLTSHVAKPGNGDVWDYVIVKRLPYATIMIVIIYLFKAVLSIKKEYRLSYDTRKKKSKFLNDDMRYYLFIASSVLLGQQIYYQIVYKLGFPFIYGPMFIVIPAVYLLYYLYQTNLKKRIL